MSQDNSTVTYKDIPGFPGYRVGDDGSVWSARKKRGRPGIKDGGSESYISNEWRQLKAAPNSSKRLALTLCVGNKPSSQAVHRLVLLAFVGPCPEGMECCHFPDRDPTNNALSNLRWDTKKANMADAEAHGTRIRGERQGLSKLTAAQVREIRRTCVRGHREFSRKALAQKYGVTPENISAIVHRRTWRHVV